MLIRCFTDTESLRVQICVIWAEHHDVAPQCEARVHFQGHTGVTSESLAEAVASIPSGYGRLRATCAVLHAIATSPPAKPSAPPAALPPPTLPTPLQSHTPAPVPTPQAPVPTHNGDTTTIDSLPKGYAPAEAASEVGCQTTGPEGLDRSAFGGTPCAGAGGVEQAGDVTGLTAATPAPPAALSGDTVMSGVGSSCVPGGPGAPSTDGPLVENDPFFSRAFSNPLFNQQTPGGFPRPI